MRVIIRWILIVLTIVFVGLGVSYLYFIDFGRHNILSIEPRKPKNKIATTYEIGWWTNLDSIHIDSLKVKIIESKLNLFNAKSLISYKIVGHIGYKGHWVPSIDGVHISERLNRDTSLNVDRIIELTPFTKVDSNEKVMGGTIKFNFTNEIIINSNHWGDNLLKFTCFDKEQVIQLEQIK